MEFQSKFIHFHSLLSLFQYWSLKLSNPQSRGKYVYRFKYWHYWKCLSSSCFPSLVIYRDPQMSLPFSHSISIFRSWSRRQSLRLLNLQSPSFSLSPYSLRCLFVPLDLLISICRSRSLDLNHSFNTLDLSQVIDFYVDTGECEYLMMNTNTKCIWMMVNAFKKKKNVFHSGYGVNCEW